jgi:hypothetical protein
VADRIVTVKWYENSTDPPDPDDDDWYDEGECTDEGEQVFTVEDLYEDGDRATFGGLVAGYLRAEGVYAASSMHFAPDSWYQTEPYMAPHSGVTTERSYHITGLNMLEQRLVYRRVMGRGV